MPFNRFDVRFPDTRWTWIAAAASLDTSEARDAFAELCRAYWYPVYVLIRSRGHSTDEASDLAQEYFARLLEGKQLRAVDRAKGRFRTFLQTDCGFFLADQGDRRRAYKRGGHLKVISLDSDHAEGRFRLEIADGGDPMLLFDRAWALAVLERAFARLARDEAESGRGVAFERLKGVLTDGLRVAPYAAIAEDLGTTVAAVQAAVVRLRRRYRLALRAEVAATLESPSEEEIDDEVRSLFIILAR